MKILEREREREENLIFVPFRLGKMDAREEERSEKPDASKASPAAAAPFKEEDLFGSDSEDDQVKGEEEEKKTENSDQKNKSSAEGDGGVEDVKMEEAEKFDEELFGSDDDSEGEKEDMKNEKSEKKKSEAPLVEDDDDDESEEEEEKLEDLVLVRDKGVALLDTVGKGDKDKTFLAKLQNLVAVDQNEFDPSTYDRDAHLGETVIRWRRGKGGEGEIESNARLVRWSNGSTTLQVGEKHLEILSQNVNSENYFIFARHNVDKVGEEGFLEGCCDVPTRLTVLPSLKNIRRNASHGTLSKGLENKGASKRQDRQARTKVITVLENPEMVQMKREREEQKKLKEQERLQKKQERELAKYGLTSYGGDDEFGDGGLSVRYLEEGEYGDDGGQEWDERATRRAREALATTRTRTMGDSLGEKRILSAQQEGEEEQTIKRQRFAKGLDESDEEEEEEKRATTRGKAILMSDDEEGD